MRAIGRQFEDDRNTLWQEPATIVDFFASRSPTPRLHVFAAVENLFDEVVAVGRTPVPTDRPATHLPLRRARVLELN